MTDKTAELVNIVYIKQHKLFTECHTVLHINTTKYMCPTFYADVVGFIMFCQKTSHQLNSVL